MKLADPGLFGATKQSIDEAIRPIVVASVSGGKDSTALALWLKEKEIPFQRIFMDTGWENAETYDYLRNDLPNAIGEITWLRAEIPVPAPYAEEIYAIERLLGWESPMVRLVVWKGTFPARVVRFCTEYLKAKPALAYFKGLLGAGPDCVIVNTIGIRSEESLARALLPCVEIDPGWNGAITWRPILHWTEADVIAQHKRHGIRPNPNYLRGSSRVGCWPCIFARKAEIRSLAQQDPTRIEVIRRLEGLVNRVAADRAARKGEDLRQVLAWFQNPSTREEGADLRWPIDRVVEWSKTSHGGRQMELFDLPEGERGCLRWGLCDSGPPAGAP